MSIDYEAAAQAGYGELERVSSVPILSWEELNKLKQEKWRKTFKAAVDAALEGVEQVGWCEEHRAALTGVRFVSEWKET